MSKNTKRWIISAILLILIGFAIIAVAIKMSNCDFKNLSTATFENNHHELDEPIQNISIEVDTADVTFKLTDGQTIQIDCHEDPHEKHTVTSEEETLIIKVKNEKKWYEYLGIRFSSPKITLSLPKQEWGILCIETDTGDITLPKDFSFERIDISSSTATIQNRATVLETIKVKNNTGDIFIENICAKNLDLSLTTGDITLNNIQCSERIKATVTTGKIKCTDIRCNDIESKGSTGDLLLKNIIAKNAFSLERSTGDIRLEDCDAEEVYIQTDTGDVSGNFLSDKIFITQTDTGHIDVPKTITGGRCEITTDTGNIKFH